jgi:hypothetical protein
MNIRNLHIHLALIAGLLISVFSTSLAQPGAQIRIVFKVQPSNTVAGSVISPALVIEALNRDNNTEVRFNEEVTISISNNAGEGTLSGTVTVRAIDGIAIFNDLSIDKTGIGYTLQAQAPTVATIESIPFTITADAPAQLLKISGDNQSGSINTPLSEPFVVEVRDQFDNLVPNASVNFSILDQPSGAGATLNPTSAQTGQNGRASTVLTLGSIAGVYTVGAAVTGTTSQTFTATLPSYTVSGTITRDGLPLAGVTVNATGGHSQTVTTNTNGVYTITNVANGTTNITITPSLTGHSFTPASRNISGPVTSNVTGENFTAALLTYTITGTITRDGSGLQGVTVTASGGHSQTVTTNSNGVYTLTNVIYGTTNITITPSLTGHSFSPSDRSVSGPVTSNVTGENFTAALLTYTITGTITRDGSGLQGVTVTASGGHSQSVTTNSNGLYTLTNVVYGSTGITITPSLTGHSFSPSDRSVSGPVTSNVTGENFTAALLTYTITGTITRDGSGLQGVSVTASGGHSQTVSTNSNGVYTLSNVVYGTTNITITPSLTGHSFTPASRNISGPVTSNVTGENFTAALLTYTITGTITRDGSGLQGVSVTASGGHSQSVTTNSNGIYTLTNVVYGSTGITITPSLTGHSFSPSSRSVSGPVTSNVTGENFTAAFLTYTITGTITRDGSGLQGVTVTASGGHSQTVSTNSSGVYTLTNVVYGTTNITITPSLTGHSFSPSSRSVSGPVTSNVTGQNFTAALLTYTITGTITRDGSGLQGVTVTASGGHSQSVTTNSNGVYTLSNVVYGTTNITITPSLTGHSFTPSSRSVSGPITSNVTGENFTASLFTYTITGTIRKDGDPLQGVTVTAAGGHTQTVTTNSDGLYRLTNVLFGSMNIIITPELTGHNFEPSSRTVTGPVNSNVTGRDFTAFLNTYTVSGTISGDTQADVTITVTGGHSATTQSGANGTYSIAGIPHGSTITVTPTKTGFSFSPNTRQLSNVTSNQTGQNFSAVRWRLDFSVQPSDARAGEPIEPAVTVRVLDANNTPVSGFTGQITVAIQNNPSDGTLSGTTSVRAVNGIATFPNLSIDIAGEGYTLRATSSGLTSATSSDFTIIPGEAVSLTFSQQPSDTVAGENISPPVVVHALDAFDNIAADYSGEVSVTLASNPATERSSVPQLNRRIRVL